MSVIADILVLAVLALCVWFGARRGLLKSVAGLIIVLVALWGASWASEHLSEPVANWLEPKLTVRIEQQIQGDETVDSSDADQMLQSFNFRGKGLQEMLDKVQQQVRQTGQSILTAVAVSVAHSIAGTVVYVVALIVLLLALWLLMKPLNLLATKLPLVSKVNAMGGGLLGLICGGLLLFALVWVMLRFGLLLTQELVDGTILLKFFATNTPLGLLAAL